MFHVYNGDNFTKHATLAEAMKEAGLAIDVARDCCDPGWPEWVEQIAIYEAPEDCEYPDEDGICRAYSKEIILRDAEEGAGVDYWCDYKMADGPVPERTSQTQQ